MMAGLERWIVHRLKTKTRTEMSLCKMTGFFRVFEPELEGIYFP